MKKLLILTLLCVSSMYAAASVKGDWLIDGKPFVSKVSESSDGKMLFLDNGLVKRSFFVSPNLTTYSLRLSSGDKEYVRTVGAEAELTINQKRYSVGGVESFGERAYVYLDSIANAKPIKGAFQYKGYTHNDILERFEWNRNRWASDTIWPPKGKEVTFFFEADPQSKIAGTKVEVHYEIYDGLPLLSKWIVVKNQSGEDFTINGFVSELISFVEEEASVDDRGTYGNRNSTPLERKMLDPDQYRKDNFDEGRYKFLDIPNVHIESDYAFYGFTPKESNQTVCWKYDPKYTSQISSHLRTPCQLVVTPPIGPDEIVKDGQTFESFRTWELFHDSYDRERKGLSVRKMYRTIAPWVTENPIYMHITFSDPNALREAVDQCAETGFEMIILSFGSGLNMNDASQANIDKFRDIYEYANGKGIEIGGYSLLSSRRVGGESDIINPENGKVGNGIHGGAPCLGSDWGISYIENIKKFMSESGLAVLEHDGSYPGHICGSPTHKGHNGTYNSQWAQWKQIAELYKWARSKGFYLTVPDWYFLTGASKMPIGYREVNWSLPRDQQIMIGRQNIYDGTWGKTPSMGFTFVPLTQYHGGGEAATLEPLSEHLVDYGRHMSQNFGSGVQACYRGKRLYDTEETKEFVKKHVELYNKYRDILTSDIIHIRRPDGKDYDAIMHVNPALKEKGFLMVYNPCSEPIRKKITIPLYYTGLTDKAFIRREEDGVKQSYKLQRDYSVELEIDIPAKSYKWYLITDK